MKKKKFKKSIWLIGGTGIIGREIYKSLKQLYKVTTFHKTANNENIDSFLIDFTKDKEINKFLKLFEKKNPDFILFANRYRFLNKYPFKEFIESLRSELKVLYTLVEYLEKKKKRCNLIVLNSSVSNKINIDQSVNYHLIKNLINNFIQYYNTVGSKDFKLFQITFGEILIKQNEIRNSKVKKIYKKMNHEPIKIESLIKLIKLIIENLDILYSLGKFDFNNNIHNISIESYLRKTNAE